MKRAIAIAVMALSSFISPATELLVDRPSPAHQSGVVGASPVLSWSYAPSDIPIANGGFEQRLTNWTASARVIVTNRGPALIEGTNFARIEYGSLSRELLVPVEPSTLAFDAFGNFLNYCRIQLRASNGDILHTIPTAIQGQKTGWNFYRADLAPFAGQTLQLRISADPVDTGVYTYFDDFHLSKPQPGVEFEVYFGADSASNLQRIGATTACTWPLRDLIAARIYYWRVDTILNGQTNTGPVWYFFTSGGLSRPSTLTIAAPPLICPGEPTPMPVNFYDPLGFLVRSSVTPTALRIYPSADGANPPGIVISEIDPGVDDGVEIMNVSENTLPVGGYRLYVYDSSFTFPNPRVVVSIPAETELPPGGVLTFRERQFTVTKTNLNLPAVSWTDSRSSNLVVAVLLKDATTNTVDAVIIDNSPTDYIPGSEVPRHGVLLGVVRPYEWISDTITSYETNKTYQRKGSRDTNHRDDWALGVSTFGAPNVLLNPPFSKGYGLVPGSYTNTSRGGYITSTITFTESYSNVVVYGQIPGWENPYLSGSSKPFEVVQPGFCISLLAPDTVPENGGTISVPVRIGISNATDVQITLQSSDTNVLRVPSTITIPAGFTEAIANFTIIDNSLLEPSKVVIVTASAPSFAPGSAAVRVNDDETTILTITGPDTVREGEVVEFTIHSSVAPATVVPVRVQFDPVTPNSDSGAGVLLRAGSNSVTFAVGYEDPNLQGNSQVTVTASFEDWPAATAQFQFIDNEKRYISLVIQTNAIEGSRTIANIYLDGSVTKDTVIKLESANPELVVVPTNVTLYAGMSSIAFDVEFPQNTNRTGQVPVAITATSPTFDPALVTIFVADDEPDYLAVELPPGPWQIARPVAIRLRALTTDGYPVENFEFSTATLAAFDKGSGRQIPINYSQFQWTPTGWTGSFAVNELSDGLLIRASAHGFSGEAIGSQVWANKPTGLTTLVYSARHDIFAFPMAGANLILIEGQTGAPITLDLPVHDVVAAVVSDDGNTLYAAGGGGGTLSRIDLATRKVTGVLGNAGVEGDFGAIQSLAVVPGLAEDRLIIFRRDVSTLLGKDIVVWENGQTLARLPFTDFTNPTIGAEPFTGVFYLADGYNSRRFELRGDAILHRTDFDLKIGWESSNPQDRPFHNGLFFEPHGYLLDPFAGGFYSTGGNIRGAAAWDKQTSRLAWVGLPIWPSATLKVFEPIIMRTAAAIPLNFMKENGWFLESAGARGWALINGGDFYLLPNPVTNSASFTDLHLTAEARRHPESARVTRIYVTVENKGPLPAVDAMIGLSLPHDAYYLASSNSLPAATNTFVPYQFAIGTLAVGEIRSAEFDLTAPFPRLTVQSADIRATVFAASNIAETNYWNNRVNVSFPMNFENEPVGPHVNILRGGDPHTVRITYTGELGWAYQLEATSNILNGWDVISPSQRPAESDGEFIANVGPNTIFFRVVRTR